MWYVQYNSALLDGLRTVLNITCWTKQTKWKKHNWILYWNLETGEKQNKNHQAKNQPKNVHLYTHTHTTPTAMFFGLWKFFSDQKKKQKQKIPIEFHPPFPSNLTPSLQLSPPSPYQKWWHGQPTPSRWRHQACIFSAKFLSPASTTPLRCGLVGPAKVTTTTWWDWNL